MLCDSPMLVTLSPMVMLVRPAENALDPMLVTLLGMVTLVRLVQLENAESAMSLTGLLSTLDGRDRSPLALLPSIKKA